MLHAKLRNRACQGLDRQGQGQGPSLQGPGQGQGLDLQGQGLTSLPTTQKNVSNSTLLPVCTDRIQSPKFTNVNGDRFCPFSIVGVSNVRRSIMYP